MPKRNMKMMFGASSKKIRSSTPPSNSTCTMESPFDTGASFSIYLEPILNPYWKTYSDVLTLSRMPNGPLRNMVMAVNFPRLSPFQENPGPFYNGQSCVPCVMRYPVCSIGGSGGAFRNEHSFMGADDIGALFSYLQEQGYVIQEGLTNMVFEGNVPVGGVSSQRFSGNRKLVAMVRYPNVNTEY